jgi:hypothetical protein
MMSASLEEWKVGSKKTKAFYWFANGSLLGGFHNHNWKHAMAVRAIRANHTCQGFRQV